MNKHTIFYILIILNIIAIPLIAEEEEGGAKAPFFKRKIIITSLSIYGGGASGLMGGAILGNCIRKDKDSMGISLAKVGVSALIGGVCGTIAGKNIAHTLINYHYPQEKEEEIESNTPHIEKNKPAA